MVWIVACCSDNLLEGTAVQDCPQGRGEKDRKEVRVCAFEMRIKDVILNVCSIIMQQLVHKINVLFKWH